MKIEEIHLAFSKNQKSFELAVIDDVQSKSSKADSALLEGSKLAQKAAQEYAKAAQLAAEAESMANKGISQAKELGANTLLKELQGWQKGLSSRIKRANKAESTLKGIN